MSVKGRRPRPRPTREALVFEYGRAASVADLATLYKVSASTVRRWFQAFGIEARPSSSSVLPERRRGGRRYKRTGKLPQHVTVEAACKLREVHAVHPELTLREKRDLAGLTCSRQMIQMILQGRRITAPEAFPKKTSDATRSTGGVPSRLVTGGADGEGLHPSSDEPASPPLARSDPRPSARLLFGSVSRKRE